MSEPKPSTVAKMRAEQTERDGISRGARMALDFLDARCKDYPASGALHSAAREWRRIIEDDALAALRSVAKEGGSDQPTVDPTCCIRCSERADITDPLVMPRQVMVMYACSTCGNKRCPHATDHRLRCTASNEPDQPGSAYARSVAKEEEKP
jgi:hypothetical protein